MLNWFKKLAKGLLMLAAVGVILLAIAIGALRLALTQLPSYQAELQAWVAAELGLNFQFDAVDARWGLRGPELTFHEASVAGTDADEPFLFAARAAITVDPLLFVLERELTASRLTFDGTRVTIVHGLDGAYRVQGAPVGGALDAELDAVIPQRVQVAVRDSELLYIDAATEESWQFTGVAVDLTRGPRRLAFELRAAPPPALASRVELSLEGEISPDSAEPPRWRVFSSLREVDLAALVSLAPTQLAGIVAGRGDVSFWLDWAGDRPVRATADLGLVDVVTAGAPEDVYDQVEMTLEWAEDSASRWRLAFSDVSLSRNGEAWPSGGNTRVELERIDGALQQLSLRSDFLRVDDLGAFVLSWGGSELAGTWRTLAPRGDLNGIDASFERTAGQWDYDVSGGFNGFGLAAADGRPGVEGLSGELRADARSGRVAFQSRDLVFDWPQTFRAPLAAEQFDGIVVWRLGRNVVRIVSDDLVLALPEATVNSDLELTLPLDGGSPRLDLESTVSSFEILPAKRYLPAPRMQAPVIDWLDRALMGGRVHNMTLSFFGALSAFPFDARDGQFRVTADIAGAELEFIDGWPSARDLDGRIEFLNAGFSAQGSGRVLGNASRNVEAGIADMRDPVLSLRAVTNGDLSEVLDFLKGAPLIAQHLGPGYERVHALGGTGRIDLALDLPLLDFSAYGLEGRLDIGEGMLAFDGMPVVASEINGSIDIQGTRVTAEGIVGIFLDGPVTAGIQTMEEPGYRAKLSVDGETTADAVLSGFGLPFANSFAGQTRWQGELHIPAVDTASRPVRISVASNLTGMALKFPAPLLKAPGEPSNLQLQFEFANDGELHVAGNLGATRQFVLDYLNGQDGYRLQRGSVQFGGEQPQPTPVRGVTVRGSLPMLNFNEWLALADTADLPRSESLLVDTELELAELFVFGQQLGSSRFSARRGDDAWHIELDSEAIAGRIDVPLQLSARPQIVADMERLYLSGGEGATLALDPRDLPGLAVKARAFGVGERRLGAVSADLQADPMGLRLVSFESSNEYLSIAGSGSWLSTPGGGAATRIALSMTSTDVAGALGSLGIDPIIEGEVADVTASVHWPGPPASNWLDHVSGDVALRVETGSMPDLDPGAGRVMGLMSIVALPRRLALDFRDVFNKGLVFDEITGDFNIVDGNAFTDNLKLAGPGAEIGIVGRTGLRDRDYEQQAVVTAEPGNILPTVGGLLAGPGVGAALLIFTRIFKKPLRGIGQASYCIQGSWQEPKVERMSAERIQGDALCAALPPEDLTAETGVN